MTINPHSAFTRVYFDMPTALAVRLDEHLKAQNWVRKIYILRLIEADLNSKNPQRKIK